MLSPIVKMNILATSHYNEAELRFNEFQGITTYSPNHRRGSSIGNRIEKYRTEQREFHALRIQIILTRWKAATLEIELAIELDSEENIPIMENAIPKT